MNRISFASSLDKKIRAAVVGAIKRDGTELNIESLLDQCKDLELSNFVLKLENLNLRKFIDEHGLSKELKKIIE